MKLVFLGTPGFAAGILSGLLEDPACEVLRVYTQPDRPAGRGKKVLPPPVKVLAGERGIPVRQPLNFRDPAEREDLAALAPDFLVVAAYGLLLPQAVLDIPKFAPINVHTSLLPAWRGAAPVQRALMAGDAETGVSVMRMEAGLDTGPVYARKRLPTAGETAGSLLEKMAVTGAELLLGVLRDVTAGRLTPRPQEGEASYAPKIRKEEGLISLRVPVRRADCLVRGLTPAPGAHVTLSIAGEEIPVVLEEVLPGASPVPCGAGQVIAGRKGLYLSCEDGALKVLRLRPQGRKSMDAASFLNGRRLAGGEPAVAGRVLEAPVTGGS